MITQTPEVSIVTCSYRPGGVDILLAGLRDQTFPRENFECIFVDHRYELRHDRVRALAREYGLDDLLLHVPEHRRDRQWGMTSSAFNTGFALARGRVVIMLVDYTYAPPGWIEAHLKHHQGSVPVYVYAPYWYHAIGITQAIYDKMAERAYNMPAFEALANQPPLRFKKEFDTSGQDERADTQSLDYDAVLRGEVFDEISVFEEGLFDPAWLSRMPPLPPGDPGGRDGVTAQGASPHYTWTHLKNESLLRSTVLRLNGTDVWSERGGRMQIDTDFGLRVSASGASLVWETGALAHCVNPRHGICRTMPFGDAMTRHEGRWNLEDCQRYRARRESEVMSRGLIAAPAPYTLESLGQKLAPWRQAKGDWIDVASVEQHDRAFFGREIWPDSEY